MHTIAVVFVLGAIGQGYLQDIKKETTNGKAKALSVFNVVTFPNAACGGTSGYNGTCYTASECTALSGTAAGTCASSFGVCCVFSIWCGSTSSQNNTYAIISSYSVSSDADPCSYTFCKANSDVCKLRIDFDTMVLAAPDGITTPVATAAAYSDGAKVGDCATDTLSVSNPGGSSPPITCGVNSGQHMFVPASSLCNVITIDIDVGTTTTTRQWQIKTSQFECGSEMSPSQNCLQYLTAETGTIASFNWDMSSTTVSDTQYHLSNQHYDICIRRARGKCSVCYTPAIPSGAIGTAASYGLGASGATAAQSSGAGVGLCTGTTSQSDAAITGAGKGDYLEIANMQDASTPTTAIAGTIGTSRICGALWVSASSTTIAHTTVCSFVTPFKVGVHMDSDEAIATGAGAITPNFDKGENDPVNTAGAGNGYSGFWLTYFQNTC